MATSVAADAMWEAGGGSDADLWRKSNGGRTARVVLSTVEQDLASGGEKEKDESMSTSVVLSSHATAMSGELQWG